MIAIQTQARDTMTDRLPLMRFDEFNLIFSFSLRISAHQFLAEISHVFLYKYIVHVELMISTIILLISEGVFLPDGADHADCEQELLLRRISFTLATFSLPWPQIQSLKQCHVGCLWATGVMLCLSIIPRVYSQLRFILITIIIFS